MVAGIGLGCGQYFYASRFAEYGLPAAGIFGPGTLTVFLTTKIIRVLYHRCKFGRWTLSKNSAWWRDDTNSVRWSSLIPLLVAALTNVSFTVCMTYAWGFSVQAGLNQGIITSLMNLLAIFDCVVFYFAFGEKVGKIHILGVALMIAGIVCIGFAVAAGDDEEGEAEVEEEIDTGGRSKTLNGILAISIGMGGPISIAIQHYFIRKYSG